MSTPRKKMPVFDHLGNEFPHKMAMLKYWHIHPMVYDRCAKRGYSLNQILDKTQRPKVVKVKSTEKKKVIDFRGTEYKNLADMCKKFHIDKDTFRAREEEGLSLRECLLGEDEDRRCLVMPKQSNYDDLLNELSRLEKKMSVLKRHERDLLGVNSHFTEILIEKIESAGVAIATANSYANSIIARKQHESI